MLKSLMKTFCGGIILVVGAGMPALGDSFTFDFTNLTYTANNTIDESSAIASILQSQLQTAPGCSACTVTVLSGAVVDRSYNGEGFAVGPRDPNSPHYNVVSETLGDTPANAIITSNSQYSYSALTGQGYTNNFLSNTTDYKSHQVSNEIVLQFGGLSVTGASFNYEIFPDNGIQGVADFIFQAGNNTNGVDTQIFKTTGATPTSSGGSDGTSTHSPNSTGWSSETNVQYISSYSGTFSGSTELDFVDWPATIGIDHLTISSTTLLTPTPSVPEPTSLLLFASVLAIIGIVTRRRVISSKSLR